MQKARTYFQAIATVIRVFDEVIGVQNKERILFDGPIRPPCELKIPALVVKEENLYVDSDDKETLEKKALQLREAFIDAVSELDCIDQPEQEERALAAFNEKIQQNSLSLSTWDVTKIIAAAKKRIQAIGSLEDAPVRLLCGYKTPGVHLRFIGKKLKKLPPDPVLSPNVFGGHHYKRLVSAHNFMTIKEGQSCIIQLRNNREVKIHCYQRQVCDMRFEEMFQHLISSANQGKILNNDKISLPVYQQYTIVQSFYQQCRPYWPSELEKPIYPSENVSIFQQRQPTPTQQPTIPSCFPTFTRRAGTPIFGVPLASPARFPRPVAPPLQVVMVPTNSPRPRMLCQASHKEASPAKRPRIE